MKKRKDKKRRRADKAAAPGPSRGPHFAKPPWAHLSLKERKEFGTALREQAKREREEALSELQDLTRRVEPFLCLAVLASYTLTAFVNTKGVVRQNSSPVQQGHVEFLQALFLRHELAHSTTVATPNDITVAWESLPKMFRAHQFAGSHGESAPETANGRALLMVQEYLRAHTSVVRNWGYFGNVVAISRTLFARMDLPFKEQYGLTLTDLLRVFEHLVRRQEDEVSAHWRAVQDVLRPQPLELLVDRFFERFPFMESQEAFARDVKENAGTPDRARYALLPLADRYLVRHFFFTSESVAQALGLGADVIQAVLHRLSLPMGALEGTEPRKFFLDNPVWLRPLVQLSQGTYFCALPQTLFSFVNRIVDELMAPDPRLVQRFADVRAKFIEDDVERLMRLAFPSAQIARSYKWRSGEQEFETDLMLRFDTTLVIVEAKSGKVSWPALRGAPSRLIEHVRTLIVEPSEQSGRLAKELQHDIAAAASGQPGRLLNFPLPLDGVRAVQRLSVTLHDFATVQSVPTLLQEAGILETEYPLAPCLSLADLEVMTELLEEPYRRLHYLRQRASTLLSQHVVGDELDMLGLYLDTGLDFGGLEPGSQQILLSGYSQRIDTYFTRKDEGLPARKPKPATSAWFKRLCEQISGRPVAGWTEMTTALLSLSPDEQVELERRIQDLARRLRAGKPLPNGFDSVIRAGPKWTSTALAIRARAPNALGPAGARSGRLAEEAFKEDHVERCCVIVVDATMPALPYLAGSVWYRTDRQVPATIFF